MFVKERIYSIRLAEAVKKNPEYGKELGLTISVKRKEDVETHFKEMQETKKGEKNETRI